MQYYKQYMDDQSISPVGHARLLALAENMPEEAEERPAVKSARRWQRYAALAACCALLAGVGLWKLSPQERQSSSAQFATASDAEAPDAADTYDLNEERPDQQTEQNQLSRGDASYSLQEDGEYDKLMFPMIPYVEYADVTDALKGSPSLEWALLEGSSYVDLTQAQIQEIFWGPEGKPTTEHPKAEQGDLPWLLMWDSYTLSAIALYDPAGVLDHVSVHGEHPDGAFFTLNLAPERMPYDSVYYSDAAVNEIRGTQVAAWCLPGQAYCNSEFMSNGVGVHFENSGAPFQVDNGEGWDALAASQWFNSLFVNWATYADCPLTLEHLLQAEQIPE